MNKRIPKIAMILSAAIINPIVACLIWFAVFWILFNMPRSLVDIFWPLVIPCICIQSSVIVITSTLVNWLMRRKLFWDSLQLKIALVFSDILFMVMMFCVAKEYPDHLPEGPGLAAALFALLALGTAGIFLVILLFSIVYEYIKRKKAKTQILEHDDNT